MSGEVLSSMFKVISNRIRRNIVQLLSEENMTYLELLISCGLNPDRHCGWFDYHLRLLLDEGVVAKEENQYSLTDFGRGIARLLDTIEGESHRVLYEEVTHLKKEEAIVIPKVPSIEIKEIPDGKLTISLDHRQPLWWQGECRIYEETGNVPTEKLWGRNNYVVYTCLERISLPKKEEYRYVRSEENYFSKYDGTEENRSIVQRTEEGYFLDSWTKVWEVQKQDGLYTTKYVNWCVRGPTEPQEFPPEKVFNFPLIFKAGQKGEEGPVNPPYEHKEITYTTEWEIIGDYEIKIDKNAYECLLKRVITTFMHNNKMYPNTPRFITDTYYTKELLEVLRRRWDRLVFIKHMGYKNWENSPTLKYKGETYYLTDEDYLAERYIPIVNLGRTEDPLRN